MNTPDTLSNESRTWGMICHLSAFSGLVIPYFGSVIGPAVVWLIKKDDLPFVDDQGREALNFQITMLIANVIAWLLTFVVVGYLLVFALPVLNLVLIIVATIKAKEGHRYRYPFALRLVR